MTDEAPGLVFEMRLQVALEPPIDQGTWEGLRRRIVPISQGVVSGPRFSGKVVPGGADWQTLAAADGLSRLDARYTLQHDDGTIVQVSNQGVRRGPPEVMAALAAGETVDPSTYYFRATPRFEVPPGPHRWLAESVFVCVGKRWPAAVELDFYRVL
jgi:hypothetical protein